jgi:hypothetical protein
MLENLNLVTMLVALVVGGALFGVTRCVARAARRRHRGQAIAVG